MEMQIKITMRYHLTPVRIAIIEELKNNDGKDVQKRESITGGNVN